MGNTYVVTASETRRYEREHKAKPGPKPTAPKTDALSSRRNLNNHLARHVLLMYIEGDGVVAEILVLEYRERTSLGYLGDNPSTRFFPRCQVSIR